MFFYADFDFWLNLVPFTRKLIKGYSLLLGSVRRDFAAGRPSVIYSYQLVSD